MILTVTLNPAIDRSYRIDNFIAGDRFCIKDVTESIGGKGINVAKILHDNGNNVYTIGLSGGFNGKHIVKYLNSIHLPNRFLEISHESRNFCVINDLVNQKETILNEAGPVVSESEIENFMNVFRTVLKEFDFKWVVIAGSVPMNVKEIIYYDLISIANKHGAKVVLDAKSPYLNKALLARPYLIKPNKQEFMELTGMKVWDLEKALELGKYVVKRFDVKILLSLGKNGSVYMDQDDFYRVAFEEIPVQNTIGSGDSMVAGYISGAQEGLKIEEVLIKATAFSLSNAMKKEIGHIDKQEIEEIAQRISVKKL